MKNLLLFVRYKIITCVSIVLLAPLFLFSQPTDEEILASIDLGTAWMVTQQNPDDGYWENPEIGPWETPERVAYTGFALTKLCDRAYEHFYDSPFDPAYEYSDNVIAGFNYLFLQAKGDQTGIYMLETGSGHETYNAAIALMAMAASGTPDRVIVSANVVVNTHSFAEIVDEMIEYFEWGQNDANNEEGGWGYDPNHIGWSDNSHTGYVVLGLRFAEAFGATIPPGLKTKLNVWIDYIQNDVNGDTDDGGSEYANDYETPWVNQLKTGNLLFEMSFFGDEEGDARVQDALDYIARHWDDLNGDPGWYQHIQAMFCLMKGFESFAIETIEVGGIERNWFDEFATYLVAAQEVDGNWPTDFFWADELLNTIWALYVLERVAPPPPIVYVDFDVHPTSWPNPINANSQGVTPTAILGTEDFDVTTIDVEILYLDLPEGMVYPVNWAYEDVTEPAGTDWECNDTEEGPDGYEDLTLKFNTQELVTALGEVEDGDELIIKIVGNLVDDGLAIEGDDCIVIKKKGKKDAEITSPTVFNLAQNYPNPFSGTTTIAFTLNETNDVTLKVYNLLGVEVATLYEGLAKAEQKYIIDLSGDLLSEGIYLCVLQSNGRILAINKMLLMK